jgi:hypothetical protein
MAVLASVGAYARSLPRQLWVAAGLVDLAPLQLDAEPGARGTALPPARQRPRDWPQLVATNSRSVCGRVSIERYFTCFSGICKHPLRCGKSCCVLVPALAGG